MRSDLEARREETWRRYVVRGEARSDVCEDLAAKYDVSPNTIDSDITRMDDWLPTLCAERGVHYGVSKLRELQDVRQRLHRMAAEARAADDRAQELRVQKEIARNLKRDVAIAQSVGVLEQAPAEVAVAATHDHRHGPADPEELGIGAELDEDALAHLDAIAEADPYARPEGTGSEADARNE